MNVLLVTSWATDCGIAEHSAMLIDAVMHADGGINITPSSAALDPAFITHDLKVLPDVVHLNYHAALHSRWTRERLQQLSTAFKVVVTYHDTGVPNSDQCKDICGAAHAAIVHEPFDDLRPETTRYWRMGVDQWHYTIETKHERPLLGTVGFPFPWKCYDELCKATAEAGWDILLIAPRATVEDADRWQRLNPGAIVEGRFLTRHDVIGMLAGCDATAFTYVCHNTGQSGAVLLGIAARKPVFALETCRQFRALYADPMARLAMRWVKTFDELTDELRALGPQPHTDQSTVALAEQESWTHLGKKYAALYRELGG